MSDKLPSEDGGASTWKWIALAALAIGLFIAFRFLPVEEWWESLSDWLDSIGLWAPVAFVVVYAVATVLFVPGFALTVGAGALFGVLKGTLWVVVGSNLGASAAFLIGRYLARDRVAKRIAGNEKFEALDSAIGREGWKIVVLTRLSPVFPFSLLNYAFGLAKVKWLHYAAASLVGMLPGTVMYVYLGSLGRLAAESDRVGTTKIVFYVVGFVATVLVTILITRAARKALRKKTGVTED
ncbi:MAG: TVP38/TMEM64 family protein [Verrucomicrobiales bacterium]